MSQCVVEREPSFFDVAADTALVAGHARQFEGRVLAGTLLRRPASWAASQPRPALANACPSLILSAVASSPTGRRNRVPGGSDLGRAIESRGVCRRINR